MFRLNEIYFTRGGHEARVICTDANIKSSGKELDVIALVTVKAPSCTTIYTYQYSKDGLLGGTGNASYDLISNEPNEEEKALMRDMSDLMEAHLDEGREAKLLKIIRTLRKK